MRLQFILYFLWANLAAASTASISQEIDQLIQQTLPNATIGVVVKEAASGKIIYSHNGSKLLSPASNVKLFTAAAAMYHLGPKYQYHTVLSQKKKDIYLQFTGSPSLTTADLRNLIKDLRQHIDKI